MLDESSESYDSMTTAPTSPLSSLQSSPEKPKTGDATMTPKTSELVTQMADLGVGDVTDSSQENTEAQIPLSPGARLEVEWTDLCLCITLQNPRYHSTPVSRAVPINSGTIVRKPAPPLQHSSSTESSSGREGESPRKRHERQKTMTVVSQAAQVSATPITLF